MLGGAARPQRVAVRDRLVGAAARCPQRTILVAATGGGVAPLRWALAHLDAQARGQIAHRDLIGPADGRGRIPWKRIGGAAARTLRAWPLPTLDVALAGLPESGPLLGAPTAPVVVDDFVDLQCPFCRQFALHVLPRLAARYVRDGEVQLRFQGVSTTKAAERAYRLFKRSRGQGVPEFLIGWRGGPRRLLNGDWRNPSFIEGAIQSALARRTRASG